MKRFIGFLALFLLLSVSVNAQAVAGSVAESDSTTSSFEVDGVSVILRQVSANNVVAANVYLLGGLHELTRENQGIEFLMLEASEGGTSQFPKDDLRRRMAELGSEISVNSDSDWSLLSLRSTVANFADSWAILADRLVSPLLNDSEISLVRERLVSAIKQRVDSPDALIEYLADSAAFLNHPYEYSAFGTESSLRAISNDMVREWHSDKVVRSRLRVVIVGNISRVEVEALLRSTLSKLPQGNFEWQIPQPPDSRPSGASFVMRTLPTNYLQGVFIGPSAASPDYAALRLASAVLGGRLFFEIREKRNLTYAVDAPFREGAFAIGGLYVTTTQPDAVLAIMQREIQSLQQGTIAQEGLDRLVQQFIVNYFLDNETNADQADMLARAQLHQGDWRRASSFVNELRSVTPEDLRLAAIRYFRNVRWAFVGNALRVDRRIFERF